MKTDRLWCEIGEHFWERESKRGRRPRNCPEHIPAPPAPKPPGDTTPAHVLAREAKAQKTAAKRQERESVIEEILNDPVTNEELKHKLRYVQAQLASGRRDQSDTIFLSRVRDDLVRRGR